RRAAFSVRSSSQSWSSRSLKRLSSAATRGSYPCEREFQSLVRRSLVCSISSWIWVTVMVVKTRSGARSFPRSEEEEDEHHDPDDRRRDRHRMERGLHQP